MIQNARGRKLIETGIVVLTALSVFAFMIVPFKSNNTFNAILNSLMLISILYGIVSCIIDYKKIKIDILVLTIAFFCARLVSYIINKVPITYGGSLMIQTFYLVGINRTLYSGRKRLRAILYLYIGFEALSVLMCYVNYFFRQDHVSKLVIEYAKTGMDAKTSMFQNPNTAGLMAGATIVLCLALIINSKRGKKVCFITIPIIGINLFMLFHDTGCRSAQIGLIVVVMLMVLVSAMKRLDSIKVLVCSTLLFCMLLLIPVFITVYLGDNEDHIADTTPIEQQLDKFSSGRYAIWKLAILSEEKHMLFGYGGHNNANKKRLEYFYEYKTDEVDQLYLDGAHHGSLHNGYLTMIVEAGLIGTAILLLLFLRRIWELKGRFRDGNWHYMLLIYMFWVNLFEAKFINAIFFTGFLMMVLLMPNEEEKENECKVIPETPKKEIKEAI